MKIFKYKNYEEYTAIQNVLGKNPCAGRDLMEPATYLEQK